VTRGLQASLSECEAAGAGIADAWARALRTGRRQALRTCEHRAGLSPLSESLAAQSESVRTRVAARESQVLSPLHALLPQSARCPSSLQALLSTRRRSRMGSGTAPGGPSGPERRMAFAACVLPGVLHDLTVVARLKWWTRTKRLWTESGFEVQPEKYRLLLHLCFVWWATGEWARRLHRSRPTWSGDGDCS